MNSYDDQGYSTLEAVPHQPYLYEKALPADPGKQTVPESEKQHVVLEYEKEVISEDVGLEIVTRDEYQSHHSGWFNRKWIITGGLFILLIVMAIVLGVVLSAKSKSNSLTPSSSVVHSIAAISYAVNNVNNTRIYYQDQAGEIIQASKSADNSTWLNSNLGFFPKNGSAIAAAVSRPGFTHEITVLYTDTKNLIHDIIYNSSTNAWAEGDLSSQNYITSNKSSLSAMYNQCELCANTTIIAYQDVNSFVQVGNRTETGWSLTQIGISAVENTGLGLHPFYRAGFQDQIDLYHQTLNLNLSLASWIPAGVINEVDGWVPSVQTYYMATPGTPIAVAAAYSNLTDGLENWIELLSLSKTGIEVNTWSGNVNDWIEFNNHPSQMSNSTGNPVSYSAVAVTAIGNAFGVATLNGRNYTIESWQVSDDLVDWTSTGTVDIGAAWD